MKKLAVIILNWNGLDLLKKLLPEVVKNTKGNEVDVIVADNGSSDKSVEWIENNLPEVRLLKFDKNYGFAEGYNRALAQCSEYEYSILLNSDVLVEEGWWQPLLEFMEKNPEVGACQPKIKSYHNRKAFEYAGAAGGMLDKLCYPYCRGRVFDDIENDNGQYDNKVVDISWASGACLMVRTELYNRLGGLDASFFAHQEEIDLCVRIQLEGYRVCFVPDSEVYHIGGGTLPQGNPRKTYLNFRNNLLLIYKNSPRGKGSRRTFVRRIIDTLAIGMYIVKGDFSDARAVIKAHNDYRVMARTYKELPQKDILPWLPGSDRNLVFEKFKGIFRKK